MNRKTLLIFLLATLVFCAGLLISGSTWLLIPIVEDPFLPLGTFTTWALMIALPLSIYLGYTKRWNSGSGLNQWLRCALIILIVLGVLWAPVCYLLAGNMSFSFSEKLTFQGGQTAMKIFWYFNGILAILPIIILLILSIFRK